MSKNYLFVPPSTEQHSSTLLDHQRITLVYSTAGPTPEVDDKLLLMPLKREHPAILPYATKIINVNRQASTMTLEIEEAYNKSVPLAMVIDILSNTSNEELPAGLKRISQVNFNAIIEHMGGVRLQEGELLAQVQRYIAAKGYYFDDETLYNYHICLKTRPLVILAGLSGTGKSKLSQLYAEAVTHAIQHHRYLRLAVRPSWNDDRYLLGYLNTITGEYITEPAVDFILQAEQDDDNLYFFCLDEMNLAHVEYYFSQFLSALEEDEPIQRKIPLISERSQQRLAAQGKSVDVPASVTIPANLLFTGTINVDETTQPLSDKVIDRANTIEFFAVDLDKIPERQPEPDTVAVSAWTWHSYQARQPDNTYRARIVEIGKILSKADMGLGYRVLHEIELYLANSKNLLSPEVAFDLQVKQRILPRVRGTEAIGGVLDEFIGFTKRYNLPRSEKRLDEMKFRLKRDGYTNFWR